MWVFNEYELIKLATLNYNLIPSGVPLRFLVQEIFFLLFCPNLLGRNATTIKIAYIFHPTFLCFNGEQKNPGLGKPLLQIAGPAAVVFCSRHTPITSLPASLLHLLPHLWTNTMPVSVWCR